ncbi:MAG: MarR family transcriptional regulator [Sphingomonas sp.]|nr:MarR family transcriptional regulator [Sphingomonas sp.]
MDSNHQALREALDSLDRSLSVIRAMVNEYRALHAPPPSFTIQRYIRLRRLREELLPRAEFRDPAWDILLDLRIAEMRGSAVSISSACIAAAVPASTALRHISALVKAGLVAREEDHRDGRRAFLRLTDEARNALANWEEAALKSPSVKGSEGSRSNGGRTV